MTIYILTPAAQQDINKIWDYTVENWGVDQAIHYTKDIRDACRELTEGTRHCRPAEVRERYFKSAVGSHVIYFRHQDTALEIVRILHKSMDAPLHLR
jgi:toxin ParE1/3/4